MRQFTILLILFFEIPAICFSYSLPQILDRLQKKENEVKTIKFNFTQDVQFSGSELSTRVEGTALFQKPGKIKIEKHAPQSQVTISDGKKIWVYSPGFNQVWEGSVHNWVHSAVIPKGMLPLNDYTKELVENFNLSLISGGDKNANVVIIKAVPKKDFLGYQLILSISTDNWFPLKTEFKSDSAVIETELSGFQENMDLNKKTFQFQPPPGVEVISLN